MTSVLTTKEVITTETWKNSIFHFLEPYLD